MHGDGGGFNQSGLFIGELRINPKQTRAVKRDAGRKSAMRGGHGSQAADRRKGNFTVFGVTPHTG